MSKDRASKTKGLLWVGAACALGIFLAVGVSPLAHLIPWSWEKKLANSMDMGFGTPKRPSHAQAEALLQRLVARLYPIEPGDKGFPIEVRVVKDSVVNAYAGLGGRITLNDGLLKQAESPEELAGVLAHEIEHVRHRHIMEGALVRLFTSEGIHLIFGGGSGAGRLTQFFVHADYTKRQESQADEDGLKRLQKAHVDNRGFKRFFERMESSEHGSVFLSDHPSNRERIERADGFKNEDTRPIMTAEEWSVLKGY